jgi:DNA-binding protein Fis
MSLFPWSKRHDAIGRAELFLAECCEQFELQPKTLSKCAKDWVGRRKWSEDLQEMRRLVYTAALVSGVSPEVISAHFPPRLKQDHEAYGRGQFDDLGLEDVVEHKVGHFLHRLGSYEVTDVHKVVLEQVERPVLRLAMGWSNGNQQKAARLLGISRNTLRTKLKNLKITK